MGNISVSVCTTKQSSGRYGDNVWTFPGVRLHYSWLTALRSQASLRLDADAIVREVEAAAGGRPLTAWLGADGDGIWTQTYAFPGARAHCCLKGDLVDMAAIVKATPHLAWRE